MQYLCNKHGLEKFYPKAPAKRAMIDSAMFYLVGTLYPYVARATYPCLGFPQYAGEVGHSEADAETKEKARQAAVEALAEPLEVFHRFYMDGKPFIGGDKPSIADIRLAASLEFLSVIDYPLPDWARTIWQTWRRRSATPIPVRRPTFAAISTTSDPAAPEPIGKLLRSGCSPGRAVRAGTIEAPLQVR